LFNIIGIVFAVNVVVWMVFMIAIDIAT